MTSATRSFYLQYNWDRRFMLIYHLVFQVFFYAIWCGVAARGAYQLVTGSGGEGGVMLVAGLLGLGVSVLFIAGAFRFKCRPRVWIDLDAETINYRHATVGGVLPFSEAEQMRHPTGRFSQSLLIGPRTDRTGRVNPNSGFGPATGSFRKRREGGRHFLADLLPAPFADMSDDLMIVDDLEWNDALRFALFLDLRSLWRAGRTMP